MKTLSKISFSIVLLFCLFINANAQTAANWQPVGPIAFPILQIGQINGMGRVVSMKYDPVTINKAYAVSVNSVFVTTDNTDTWNVLPGLNKMPSTACASVCIDYINTNIIYLGTGDPNYYSTSKASGVWKSTDGGNNFTLSNSGMGNRIVIDIFMSPTDNNVLVAATNNGIYKSINAGATWVQKSTVTDITGFAQNTAANSQILYFTKGAIAASGLFYSSVDFGETWQLNTGFSTPTLTYRGARVATTPANPNVVYLSFLGKGGGGPGFVSSGGGIVYKSIDGGATFTMQKDDILPNLIGYKSNEGGQGNYNFDLAVSPTDANTLFIVGHIVWKSIDGGITWIQMQPSWSVEIHTDMHKVIFNPNNTNEIYNCNDGGVWKSVDGGDTWVPKCQNLVSSEIYNFANSHFDKNIIGAGLQDNGEVYFKNGNWYNNRGGDWTSPYYFDYNSALPGKAIYCKNGSTRDLINTPAGSGTEKTLRLPFSTQNSDQYAFSLQDANTVFVMHNLNTGDAETNVAGVYRTSNLQNLSAGNPIWTKIFSQSDAASLMMSLDVDPTNANTMYLVLKNLDIYRCDNALSGAPIFNLIVSGVSLSTQFGLPTSISVADFEALKNGVLFLSLNSRVIKSVDKGATWVSYTGATSGALVSLPSSTNFLEIIQDSAQNNESLYAMSVNSIYYRNNSMNGWMLFMNNLPTTPNFTDIDIYNNPLNFADDKLRLSTYGRGLWETKPSLASPLPIKLLEFTGTNQNNINKLQWKTAFEINSSLFDIESSTDGYNFKKISSVSALGNSSSVKSYQFYDFNTLPNTKTFYRLKMIDLDGNYDYSNIVIIYTATLRENTLQVLDNPIKNGNVKLLINVSNDQIVNLTIIDAVGRLLSAEKVRLSRGNQIKNIYNKTNSSGLYFIKLVMENGAILSEKFIQQ
jgi:trimeric autotransporter adhesin